MNAHAAEDILRIKRGYNLLQEAHNLLERAGQSDICAALYLPLGMMEERFALASVEDIEAETERKNASSE